MGLDIRDVDLVMHIGCPKTLLSYWQETGRCARDGRAGYSLVLYDKFTLSLKTTEKEVAQLILNKDEKCIRQEILKFLRRRNRCWSKAIWKMQWIMRFTVSVQHVQVLFYLQKGMPMSRKPEVWHPRMSKIVIWAAVHGEWGLLRSTSKLYFVKYGVFVE